MPRKRAETGVSLACAMIESMGLGRGTALEYPFDKLGQWDRYPMRNKLRKWRFDIAWPKRKVALEIQGGMWSGGGHNRGRGMGLDHEKQNAAMQQGWRVFLCGTDRHSIQSALNRAYDILKEEPK